MSIDNLAPLPRPAGPELLPYIWGQIFGEMIRQVRESQICSIEEAALLANMEEAEWKALEAGQVPTTWEEACAIADALGASHSWIASLVVVCVGAWDKDSGQRYS